MMARQYSHVGWNHVHSHEGHPWNEAADSLAKWAATGPSTLLPLPTSVQRHMAVTAGLEWEWLWAADEHTKAAYPDMVGRDFLFDLTPACAAARHIRPPKCEMVGTHTSAPRSLHSVVGSFNACTLKEDKAGPAQAPTDWECTMTRAAVMRKHATEAKVILMGIQEARVKPVPICGTE